MTTPKPLTYFVWSPDEGSSRWGYLASSWKGRDSSGKPPHSCPSTPYDAPLEPLGHRGEPSPRVPGNAKNDNKRYFDKRLPVLISYWRMVVKHVNQIWVIVVSMRPFRKLSVHITAYLTPTCQHPFSTHKLRLQPKLSRTYPQLRLQRQHVTLILNFTSWSYFNLNPNRMLKRPAAPRVTWWSMNEQVSRQQITADSQMTHNWLTTITIVQYRWETPHALIFVVLVADVASLIKKQF